MTKHDTGWSKYQTKLVHTDTTYPALLIMFISVNTQGETPQYAIPAIGSHLSLFAFL